MDNDHDAHIHYKGNSKGVRTMILDNLQVSIGEVACHLWAHLGSCLGTNQENLEFHRFRKMVYKTSHMRARTQRFDILLRHTEKLS
jgi:hypothetical protein